MPGDVRFWDRIAAKYIASPMQDRESYEFKLAETRKLLTPQTRMLEFACGSGATAIRHAPYVAHIHATDISANMVDHARKSAEGVDNISFEQTSVEDIAEGKPYDIILGLSILHLVDDVPAVQAKVNRLLKPGGYFVSSTTCMRDIAPWLKFLAPPMQALGRIPHLNWFRRDQLEIMIKDAGFSLETVWQPAPKKALFIIARKVE